MEEVLIQAITAIRADRELRARDEASIKLAIVLHLLHLLGWNPFDGSEVIPEYTCAGRRVDFALAVAGAKKVFVEAKRPQEDLEQHQRQLLEYSFSEGVKLAVLTNGATWWLYLPLSEGSWEQRRFYSLDLLEQEPAIVAKYLVRFLAKPRVLSGTAVDDAEQVHKRGRRQAILRDAIPAAWQKLVTAPDDALVNLLIDTTERSCGLRPEVSDIEEFLQKADVVRLAPTPPPNARRPRPMPMSASGNETFIGRKIERFTLFRQNHTVSQWQELFLTVAGEMYKRHRSEFDRCLSIRGTKMVHFSRDPGELRHPREIANSGYYAETKLNSNSIVRRSKELLALFGHNENDLRITAR